MNSTNDSAAGGRVPVFVLAGGKSARFGSDKARAVWRGKALLVHVAERLGPVASELTVIAECAGNYEDLGLRTIGDREPGLGPVGGLVTALLQGHERFVLAACDFAEVEAAWVATLLAADRAGATATAFRDDRWQPMPGVYHARIGAFVEGAASMQAVLTRAGATAVACPAGWPVRAGFNTPGELRERE